MILHMEPWTPAPRLPAGRVDQEVPVRSPTLINPSWKDAPSMDFGICPYWLATLDRLFTL